MEQNTKQLESIIEKLLAGIETLGLLPWSQKHYTSVCNSIRRYQKKKAPDLGVANLLDSYMKDFEVGGRLGKGKPSLSYLGFTSSVVELLRNILTTGVFEKRVPEPRYIVSEEDKSLISLILKATKFEGKTRMTMQTILRNFFSWLRKEGLSPEDTTDDTLMEFIVNVIPVTNSRSTGTAMWALKHMSAYFKANGIGNIQQDISLLKVKAKRDTIIMPFSRDEIKKILSVVDRNTKGGKRDYAIITLGLDTGLRSIDIRQLKFGDIDWKEGTLSIVQAKTKKRVALPLSGTAMNALADYILNARPESEYKEVFLSIQKPVKPIQKELNPIVKKYSDKAGLTWIPGRGFHSLRRTFATEMASAGVKIATISQMLGHKSIVSDKPYITYDKRNTTSCAFNFDLVPIKNGIYKNTFATEGGDS